MNIHTSNIIEPYPVIFENPNRLADPLSWVQHIPFAFYLISTLKPGIFVELGTHTGNSYNAFCQAVKSQNLKTKCFAVDTWKGDMHAGFYGDEIFEDLAKYQIENFSGFSNLIRMTFDEAINEFSDASIDLLHIDGLHTYDAVKHDFETWLPKVSDRGVVIFHDTEVKERDFGVWKLWEEVSGSYPSFNFLFGYGLGVLAVGKNVPSNFIQIINQLNDNRFYALVFQSLGKLIELEGLERINKKNYVYHYAQLFVETDNVDNENQEPIRSEIVGSVSEFVYQLDKFSGIKSFRFQPFNHYVEIELDDIQLVYPDGAIQTPDVEGVNIVYKNQNKYIFNKTNSFLLINSTTHRQDDPVNLNLKIKYISKGNDTINKLFVRKNNEIQELKQSIINFDSRTKNLQTELDDKTGLIKQISTKIEIQTKGLAEKQDKLYHLNKSIEIKNLDLTHKEDKIKQQAEIIDRTTEDLLQKTNLIKNQQEVIGQQSEQLNRKDKKNNELTDQVFSTNQEFARVIKVNTELEGKLHHKQAVLKQKEEFVAQQDKEIIQKDEALLLKDKQVKDHIDIIKQKDSELIRLQHDILQTLENLESNISEMEVKDKTINKQSSLIQDKENEAAALNIKIRKLSEIIESKNSKIRDKEKLNCEKSELLNQTVKSSAMKDEQINQKVETIAQLEKTIDKINVDCEKLEKLLVVEQNKANSLLTELNDLKNTKLFKIYRAFDKKGK